MSDALEKVLDDASCQELLQTALEVDLRKDPVKFYKEIIAPRAPKLTQSPSALEMMNLTPTEEAELMDELTVAVREEHERVKAARTPVASIETA